MNTLIKRSMMLGLSLVFVGAAVVPACAQKKGLTNLPKALGKKPPLTGIKPAVRVPVTPRIPPTLQGAAQMPASVVPNAALNTTVERQIVNQMSIQQVQEQLTLVPLFKGKVVPSELSKGFSVQEWNSTVDFKNFITPATPKFVLVTPWWWHLGDMPEHLSTYFKRYKMTGRVRADLSDAFESVDSRFFRRVGDKLFLNVSAAKEARSYQNALKEYMSEYPSSTRTIDEVLRSEPIQHFIATRNLQIMTALTPDPTTQRTAEEIKFLVENLPKGNPLRQEVEDMLRDYLAPAK